MGSEGEGGTPKPTALRTPRLLSAAATTVQHLLYERCCSLAADPVAPLSTLKLGLGQLARKCAMPHPSRAWSNREPAAAPPILECSHASRLPGSRPSERGLARPLAR